MNYSINTFFFIKNAVNFTSVSEIAFIKFCFGMMGFSASGAIPGICLHADEDPGALRVVMPLASFDVRESLEFLDGTCRYLLTPIELETTGSNYEIGRYRQQRDA